MKKSSHCEMSNLSVFKSNDLIDASYRLPAQAQKLVLACLAKVDSRSEIPKEISISAKEFGDLMCIDESNVHRDLYRAAESLFDAEITIIDEGRESRLRWVQEAVTQHRGDGLVTLVWSDKVLRYISELQSRFTGYKIQNVALLQSGHSIRIYELLMRFKSTGERVIYIDDFKSALGISEKYKEFKILNRAVIKPSLKEIAEKSDLRVTCEAIKKGRKVVSLAFTFDRSK